MNSLVVYGLAQQNIGVVVTVQNCHSMHVLVRKPYVTRTRSRRRTLSITDGAESKLRLRKMVAQR